MEPDHSHVSDDARTRYENDRLQRRYPASRVRGRETIQNIRELSAKRSRIDLPFPPRQHHLNHYTDPMNYEAHGYYANEVPQTPMPIPAPNQAPRETIPISPLTLLSPSQSRPSGMCAEDALICQNVELFQSVRDDRNAEEVGIRCIHCARTGLDNSVIYPSSVETMSNSIRMMTKSHFLQCVMLPDRTREELHNYEMHHRLDMSRSEEERRRTEAMHHRALSKYCMDLCDRIHVINRLPAQTGIVFGTSNSSIKTPTTSPPSAFDRVQHTGGEAQIENPDASHSPWSRSIEDHQNTFLSSNSASVMQVPYSPARSRRDPAHFRQKSPTSLYDSGRILSPERNIPFIQTAENVWECKFCSTLPIGHRAERHAWYSSAPPDRDFMDQHLRYCAGASSGSRDTSNRSSSHMIANQGADSNSYRPFQSSHRSFQQNSQTRFRQGSDLNYHGEQSQNFNQYDNSMRSSTSDRFMGSSDPPPNWRRQQQMPSLRNTFENPNVWRAPSPHGMQPHSQPQNSYNRSNFHHHSTSQPNQMSLGYHSQSGYNNASRSSGQTPDASFDRNSQVINPARKDFEAAIKILEGAKSPIESDKLAAEVLVDESDKYLITDYFYFVMKQLRICHFKEDDRTTRGGKRDNIAIGFGGLECIHCSHTANARKFFWSNVDRLSNSFSEIPGHVLKCKCCPISIKDALLDLKKFHPEQMTARPRGSQKTFLRRVWRRLHNEEDLQDKQEVQEEREILPSVSIVTLGSDSPSRHSSTRHVAQSVEQAAEALAKQKSSGETNKDDHIRVLLAIDQDKDWGLADLDCLVRRNIELFCASEDDVSEANKTREMGEQISLDQVGIRCINCAASTEHDGYCLYPQCLDDLFPAVRAFKSKHLHSCPCFPPDQKARFESLKESSSASFGSVVRDYYLRSAEALGLRNDKSSGIRSTGVSKPINGGYKKTAE